MVASNLLWILLILKAFECYRLEDNSVKEKNLVKRDTNADVNGPDIYTNEVRWNKDTNWYERNKWNENEIVLGIETKHPKGPNIRDLDTGTSTVQYGNEVFSYDHRRYKRDTKKQQSLANIRQKLKEEKAKKHEENGFDPLPVIKGNSSGLAWIDSPFGGLKSIQNGNPIEDNMRKLKLITNREKANSITNPGAECDFEQPCNWEWKKDLDYGFKVLSALDIVEGESGPRLDADKRSAGHFLLLRLGPHSNETHLTSPLFSGSGESCKIQMHVYQEGMLGGQLRLVVRTKQYSEVVVAQIVGDDSRRWISYEKVIAKQTLQFNLIVEVVPSPIFSRGATVAFDNIKLLQCFPETTSNICTPRQYKCNSTNSCVNNSQVCDMTEDCEYGDDENFNCDKIPMGARCNFEEDWCGWYNVQGKILSWTRDNGLANKSDPGIDHTYRNSSGRFLHVNAPENEASFASSATLNSVVFNPPPRVHGNLTSEYYNSCMIRFYLHQSGHHKSGFMLQVTELRPKENITTELLWSFSNYKDVWVRQVVILPNITHRYYLHFDVRKGIRYNNGIAIDDFSLSPECFGLNIPTNELRGYDYWNPVIENPYELEPHKDFINETYFEITTCGRKGRLGPSVHNCSRAYNNTKTHIKVMTEKDMRGVQMWAAPNDGYYTFILFGASGGRGSSDMGSSRGAMIRTVIELRKGQEIYSMVGQQGNSACVKSFGYRGNSSCQAVNNNTQSGIRGVLALKVEDGGGGGGGATTIFLYNKEMKVKFPIAVAAGGGGLGLRKFVDTGLQHGQAINTSRPPMTGHTYGTNSAGAGGGWRKGQTKTPAEHIPRTGSSIIEGGVGGKACYLSNNGQGDGGFGGGGGGCVAGGGGGGYSGGNAYSENTTNGEGGYSYTDPRYAMPDFTDVRSGFHAGPGMVIIFPAIPKCSCDYRCVALDIKRSQVQCICPRNWKLDLDGRSCILIEGDNHQTVIIGILIGILAFVLVAFTVICATLYKKWQQRYSEVLRRKMMNGPDLQLDRLRIQSDGMMTEYNPNYEFGGVAYTLKDLNDIPRDQLRLIKALGQGAFGEVYQGFYRQRRGDAVEMPVAVKTLPEMSTNQAELDFLMEALIMSKFNHPNIVHFIGVCFDKHPRFIVLELLGGGDLKNFLRESRPKPERPSNLLMKDLILMAIDVAKGCKYLEDNRFIHRDIAARNCLLTTKGPGRVVKIADFGMSRDIYRSDYYRKGGKAMLPIKWMPPEAFLDGIFTSKTDVWSFGVLLWEIMSLGYMPYTGCANREVMQLVTSGGRLEPPANCPGPVYAIMTQCWHPTPEDRPSFGLILERLGYCSQDPDVMDAPLPVFSRPPSHERDATVMRPQNSNDSCLQVPISTDYLIPNVMCNSMVQNPVGSTSSVDKLLPDNSDSWETSFVMPHSRSTQPLLQEADHNNSEETTGSNEKLLDLDSKDAPTSKISPISLPNNISSNHNNNVKPDLNNLKSGVSLDASALVKQAMKYANVNTGETVTGNGIIQNGPYSNQNNYMNNTSSKRNVNESEISC